MSAPVRSCCVKDVDQQLLVKALARFLKKSGKLRVPDWADYVKTGTFKELGPSSKDWFFVRCASIARHLYFRSPAGVGGLRKVFGGRERRGVRPAHYQKASGSVVRKALQALEAVKWIERVPQIESEGHKTPCPGRRLTAAGRRDLDRISVQVRKRTKRIAAKRALEAH